MILVAYIKRISRLDKDGRAGARRGDLISIRRVHPKWADAGPRCNHPAASILIIRDVPGEVFTRLQKKLKQPDIVDDEFLAKHSWKIDLSNLSSTQRKELLNAPFVSHVTWTRFKLLLAHSRLTEKIVDADL